MKKAILLLSLLNLSIGGSHQFLPITHVGFKKSSSRSGHAGVSYTCSLGRFLAHPPTAFLSGLVEDLGVSALKRHHEPLLLYSFHLPEGGRVWQHLARSLSEQEPDRVAEGLSGLLIFPRKCSGWPGRAYVFDSLHAAQAMD